MICQHIMWGMTDSERGLASSSMYGGRPRGSMFRNGDGRLIRGYLGLVTQRGEVD